MTRDIIETDVDNMLEPELKTTMIRILAGLEKKHERHQRDTTEIKELKSYQAKMKNAINEQDLKQTGSNCYKDRRSKRT